MSIVLNFLLNNKWTYIVVLLLGIIGYILFLNIRLISKDKEIDKLEKTIYTTKTELSNRVLLKKELVKSNEVKVLSSFSNSDNAIMVISNKNLTKAELRALNTVIDDYYKTID